MSCRYSCCGVAGATSWVAEVPGISLDPIVESVAVGVIDYWFSSTHARVGVCIPPSDLPISSDALASWSNSWTCQNITLPRITKSSAIVSAYDGVYSGVENPVCVIVNIS